MKKVLMSMAVCLCLALLAWPGGARAAVSNELWIGGVNIMLAEDWVEVKETDPETGEEIITAYTNKFDPTQKIDPAERERRRDIVGYWNLDSYGRPTKESVTDASYKIYYNSVTGALELNGASIKYVADHNKGASIAADGDLNILLVGNSTIAGPGGYNPNYGIKTNGNITISNKNGNDIVFNLPGETPKLTIDNDDTQNSVGVSAASVTISSGEVKVMGGKAAFEGAFPTVTNYNFDGSYQHYEWGHSTGPTVSKENVYEGGGEIPASRGTEIAFVKPIENATAAEKAAKTILVRPSNLPSTILNLESKPSGAHEVTFTWKLPVYPGNDDPSVIKYRISYWYPGMADDEAKKAMQDVVPEAGVDADGNEIWIVRFSNNALKTGGYNDNGGKYTFTLSPIELNTGHEGVKHKIDDYPATAPSNPVELKIVDKARNTVTASWEGAGDGGDPIIGYIIRYARYENGSTAGNWYYEVIPNGATRSVDLSRFIENGKNYMFEIIAYNRVNQDKLLYPDGSKVWEAGADLEFESGKNQQRVSTAEHHVRIYPPDPVEIASVKAIPGFKNIQLTWTPVLEWGGADALGGYYLEYTSPNHSSSERMLITPQQLSAGYITVPNLINYENYTFNIWAFNLALDGSEQLSDMIEFNVPQVANELTDTMPRPVRPIPPTGLTLAQGKDQLVASWEPLENTVEAWGCDANERVGYQIQVFAGNTQNPITDYEVMVDGRAVKPDSDGKVLIDKWNLGSYSYAISKLTNGETYRVEVRAVNNIKNVDTGVQEHHFSDPISEYGTPSAHTHRICGVDKDTECSHANHQVVEFTELPVSGGVYSGVSDGNMGRSHNYYLIADTELEAPITVKAGQTFNLCLNGKMLKLIKTTGSVIVVENGGTLNLCDCSVGGRITGGLGTPVSSAAGADTRGGGVMMQPRSKFNMYGGSISNNRATEGGGVYVGENAEFAICGGTITNNVATSNGGGVRLAGESSKMVVWDVPTVIGNSVEKGSGTSKLETYANNVYLPNNAAMTVQNQLESGASIGVTTEGEPSNTGRIPVASGGAANKNRFSSDKGFSVVSNGVDVLLTQPNIPAKPIINSVEEGNRQLTVSWLPPTDDGGSSVMRYWLEYTNTTTGSVARKVDVGNNTSYTLTGLINGNTYSLRVIAENVKGLGEPSEERLATPEYDFSGSSSGTVTGKSPTILEHPRDVLVSAGQTATFQVKAESDKLLRYEWQIKEYGSTVWGTIPDSDSAMFNTGVTAVADDGDMLRVRIRSEDGVTTSKAAMLGVIGGKVSGNFNTTNSSGGNASSPNTGTNTGSNTGNSSNRGNASSSNSSSNNSNNSGATPTEIYIPKTGGMSAAGYAAAMLIAAGFAVSLRKRR